jgi:trehalose synthase
VLQLVDVGPRTIASYRGIAPASLLHELESCAADLRGARVLHVNATPYGGGVSELLRSTIPLLNDLGIVADWRIIVGGERFFTATKKIHNGLQGAAVGLTDLDRDTYIGTARRNAELLAGSQYDFVFLHDPQPAAILPLLDTREGRWVWRCHIDTSAPDPDVWGFLRQYLHPFDAAVFTMAEFVPPDFPLPRVEIMPPAIDPLSPKNLALDVRTAREILQWIGVELDRPLVTQVSRFDPWKDPLGVISAYRLVRQTVPDLQLALVGSMALDDPEGWEMYRQVTEATKADPDIHVFTNLTGVGNMEVNAFQQLSDVVIQKSTREGFGLVVSEALWKGTPVVAGRVGGIPLQMADGVGGALITGVEDCAAAVLRLLQDRERARDLGARGRERVRHHFLIPRLILNELQLMRDLAGTWSPAPSAVRFAGRDPVCGMAVATNEMTPTAEVRGVTYAFCSDACQRRFLRKPGLYLGSA